MGVPCRFSAVSARTLSTLAASKQQMQEILGFRKGATVPERVHLFLIMVRGKSSARSVFFLFPIGVCALVCASLCGCVSRLHTSSTRTRRSKQSLVDDSFDDQHVATLPERGLWLKSHCVRAV